MDDVENCPSIGGWNENVSKARMEMVASSCSALHPRLISNSGGTSTAVQMARWLPMRTIIRTGSCGVPERMGVASDPPAAGLLEVISTAAAPTVTAVSVSQSRRPHPRSRSDPRTAVWAFGGFG